MAVMIIIFVILFSVSVAALAITSSQQHALLKKFWRSLSDKSKKEVQRVGNCCGFENATIQSGIDGHPNCTQLKVFKRMKYVHCKSITTDDTVTVFHQSYSSCRFQVSLRGTLRYFQLSLHMVLNSCFKKKVFLGGFNYVQLNLI